MRTIKFKAKTLKTGEWAVGDLVCSNGKFFIKHEDEPNKVFSPIIPEGQSDILVAFDRLEALRWKHFLAKDGKVLMNNVDLVPVTVSSGLQQPVTDFEARLAKAFPTAVVVDAQKIAEEVGNARTMNMVVAGALSALTPFKESQWLQALEESFTGPKAKLLDLNRKAFELGRAAVAK